jgi:hypothetical protein
MKSFYKFLSEGYSIVPKGTDGKTEIAILSNLTTNNNSYPYKYLKHIFSRIGFFINKQSAKHNPNFGLGSFTTQEFKKRYGVDLNIEDGVIGFMIDYSFIPSYSNLPKNSIKDILLIVQCDMDKETKEILITNVFKIDYDYKNVKTDSEDDYRNNDETSSINKKRNKISSQLVYSKSRNINELLKTTQLIKKGFVETI